MKKNINKLVIFISVSMMFIGCGKQAGLQVETKNGLKHGPAVEYYGDGKISSKGQYVNGKKEGVWTSYWAGIPSEVTYKNGLKHGISKTTRQGYKKKDTTMWAYDKKNGEEIEYYRNGTLHRKTMYNMGVKGEETQWASNGSIMSTIRLDKNGKRWKHSSYYGKRLTGVTYTDVKSGNVVGVSKSYYSNGKASNITKYDSNGNEVSAKNYTYEGKYKDPAAASAEMNRILSKKKTTTSKTSSKKVTLRCKSDDSSPSMSEVSRKTAIARGKGEGAALGFHMNKGNSLSSYEQGKNFCIRNANAEGLACTYASAYVAGCIGKI